MIKPSSLGDIIHSLIVIQTLKDHSPNTVVDFVVRDRFAHLPEAASCVDNVIHFRRHHGVPAFIRLIREIRSKRYDMVWDMQGLFRSGLMTRLARADRKVGRNDSRECGGLFIKEKAPLPANGSQHAIDKLLQYLTTADIAPVVGSQVRFAAPPIDAIDPRLAGKRPIVMIPHSRGREKEWPGFHALTRELLRHRVDAPIVWDSHIRIDAGDLETHPGFVNTTAKTSVSQMIGLVQSAQLVVANDCGPMHLASALQVPTIAIFGPTPPERYGAYPLDNPRNVNLRAPNGDWAQLPLDTVVNTALRLLSTPDTSNPR